MTVFLPLVIIEQFTAPAAPIHSQFCGFPRFPSLPTPALHILIFGSCHTSDNVPVPSTGYIYITRWLPLHSYLCPLVCVCVKILLLFEARAVRNRRVWVGQLKRARNGADQVPGLSKPFAKY